MLNICLKKSISNRGSRISPEMKRKLFILTGPIFMETLMQSIMGSMDTLMLSRYSDEAVAAVGVANQILFLVQVFACIVTTGTGILCAQYIGADKDDKEQNTLIITSIVLNTGIGVLLTVLLCTLYPKILAMMHLEGLALKYAGDYMGVICLFIWGWVASFSFSVILRSYGKTRVCMYVSVLINAYNVVLNYILIFGKFGAPAMGAKGAALATVLGRMIGFFILLFLLYRLRRHTRWQMAADQIPIQLKNIIMLGVPAAGEQISYNCSQFFVMVFITMLGTKSVTAYSYLNTCVSFIYMFSMALGQGAAIMIGWSVGAGDYKQAYVQCRFSGKCALVISMIAMCVMALIRKPVFSLFTEDAEIVALACTVVMFNFIREVGRSGNLVYVNALRAAGDVKFPFYVGIVSMWGISVALAYVLGVALNWGLAGVWLALGLDECFRAACMQWRWKKQIGER